MYMPPQSSNPDIPDPEAFLGNYDPSSPVRVGDREMTLRQALSFEALLCTAEETDRGDPGKRTTFLAGALAAGGSLLPEHEHLVSKPE
jgi:hypothetical protein